MFRPILSSLGASKFLHTTRQEEAPITIKWSTTHGRIDEGIFWIELTDGRAAISTAISKHLMMTVSVETCSATVM
jgi:hypothetical protein